MNEENSIICKITFIIFLDNDGNRLYSKYYDKQILNNPSEFELKLSKFVINNSIQQNDVDIFIFEDFTIISKISQEISIFIGSTENSNEILLLNFYDTLEFCLFNIIQNSLTKKLFLENFEKIIFLIDEIVNDGIIMNINVENIDKIIKLEENFYENNNNNNKNKKENNNNNNNKSGFGNFFRSFFSNSNEDSNNKIFGNLLNDATNYVQNNINQ